MGLAPPHTHTRLCRTAYRDLMWNGSTGVFTPRWLEVIKPVSWELLFRITSRQASQSSTYSFIQQIFLRHLLSAYYVSGTVLVFQLLSNAVCQEQEGRCHKLGWSMGWVLDHTKTFAGQSFVFILSLLWSHWTVENRGLMRSDSYYMNINLALGGSVYKSSLPTYNISSLRTENKIFVLC